YMFFFNDTATTEIYTLSLHDALPIFGVGDVVGDDRRLRRVGVERRLGADGRSEEHTSELQSPMYLGCRLLLEKKTIQGYLERCAGGAYVRQSVPRSRRLHAGGFQALQGVEQTPARPGRWRSTHCFFY